MLSLINPYKKSIITVRKIKLVFLEFLAVEWSMDKETNPSKIPFWAIAFRNAVTVQHELYIIARITNFVVLAV